MKPKLIILNGSCGTGKSTLASMYAEHHPMTLRLDIDEIRRMMSQHRENSEDSGRLSKMLAVAMARTYLEESRDVVIAQRIGKEGYILALEALARECDADFYEILLDVPKKEGIRRFVERGKRNGFADGFDPNGNIAKRGKEARLAEMHDELMEIVSRRPTTIVIKSILDDIEGTYQEIMKHIST